MRDFIVLGSGVTSFFLSCHYQCFVVGLEAQLPPLFHIRLTDSVKEFLERHELKYRTKTVSVGLWDGSKLINSSDITEEMVSNYKRKTKKSSNSRFLNNMHLIYEIAEITDDKFISWFDYSRNSNPNHVRDKVVSIESRDDYYAILCESKIEYQSRSILSTIPLPILCRLLNYEVDESRFLTSHKAWKNTEIRNQGFDKFDYVYDLSTSLVNRYIKFNGSWLEEHTLEPGDSDLSQYSKVMRNVQINQNLGWDSLEKYGHPRILLFGRLAQWSNEVLVHRVIDRLLKSI